MIVSVHSLITRYISDWLIDYVFILFTFNEVVNEVGIEYSLNNTRGERDHNQLMPLVDPKLYYKLPVQDVKEAIKAQEYHNMGCYILDIFALRYHVKLRQNGCSLQPDRKSPQHAI